MSTPRATQDRKAQTARVVFSALAAFMAVWAFAGAIGLLGGGIHFGSTIDNRLPFNSPVLAGFALLLLVAVPMTVASVAAWRGTGPVALIGISAGAVLIVWIVVEIAFIRTYSWLQPFCVVYGIALIAVGMAAARGEPTRRDPPA